MSFRRHLDWTKARHDLERDRAATVAPAANPMFLRSLEKARALDARRSAVAAPLVVNGKFDLAAIMKAAVAAARAERARGVPLAWSQLMASALRAAWARAKSQH